MVSPSIQAAKAQRFLALHHDPKLLVLPNIWDPLGARMLESVGYPAVATASAAVAFSQGYDDGEQIPFDLMLDVIRRIAERVEVPVTADVERGFAGSPEDVAENMKRVLQAGAVGINLEDSRSEGGELLAADAQADRLRAVREMADREQIPLVINARTDVFLRDTPTSRSEKIEEAITRGRRYLEAGADCLYPIGAGDLETVRTIHFARGPRSTYSPQPPPLPCVSWSRPEWPDSASDPD